jgi:hypothetical protein
MAVSSVTQISFIVSGVLDIWYINRNAAQMPAQRSENLEAPDVKDLTSTSFGYVIAFLLPGLLGLYALTYWFSPAGQFISPVLKADANAGPSVIVLLVALAIGLCVSALRFFLFEKLLCRKHKFPAHMFSKLAAEGRLASFKAVVDEHYRYHQFYGGCAVAVLILYTGWFRYAIDDANLRFVLVSVAFALFELLLIVTGTDAFIRYVERGTIIVNGG